MFVLNEHKLSLTTNTTCFKRASYTVFFSFYLFTVNFILNMFGSNPSNKNGGISKKNPRPKVSSKRDTHANRPEPKRLLYQIEDGTESNKDYI